MSRWKHFVGILSCVTVLSLVPLPWSAVVRILSDLPLQQFSSLRGQLPFAFPAVAAPAAQPNAQSAIPPEDVTIREPGPADVATPPHPRMQRDLGDQPDKGPGAIVAVELPSEPRVEVEMRLRGVGAGYRGRQNGDATTFDIPREGKPAPAGSSRVQNLLVPAEQTVQLIAAAPGTPEATTTVTATPRAVANTSTPTASATRSAATATPTLTVSPTAATVVATKSSTPTSGSTVSPTPIGIPVDPEDPTTPSVEAGNRYGAALALSYRASQDDRELNETLTLAERSKTNSFSFDFAARGLTIKPQADGSLSLNDHNGAPMFKVPAPEVQDARGRQGGAHYLVQGDQLDIVVDQSFLDSAAYPVVIDPTIIVVGDLISMAAAPWQRVTVAARDGTQAMFFYNDDSGALKGIDIVTSTNDWASFSGPSLAVATVGSQGFSVEIDETNDTIYLALTARISSSNKLRLIPFPYNSGTRTWSAGTAIDIQANGTTSWSGATVVIEQGATRYLWVGADQRTGTTSGTYAYKAWFTALPLGGSPTWTSSNPSFTTTASNAHYGALVAVQDGVTAVARSDSNQRSSMYTRGSGWGSVLIIDTAAFPNTGDPNNGASGKPYALIAIPDNRTDGTVQLLPVVAFSPTTGSSTQGNLKYYVKRFGSSSWESWDTGEGSNGRQPQLAADGTGFYAMRLRSNGGGWAIGGSRVRLLSSTSPSFESEADHTYVLEASPNDQPKWIGLPRRLGTQILPIFYVRQKTTTDELAIQAQAVKLVGERTDWSYQTIALPGAGQLQVNLANGNLHYTMTDGRYPSRTWDDVLSRAYDALSDVWDPSLTPSRTMFSKGWTSSLSPRLQFFQDETLQSTSDANTNKIIYWAADGSHYLFAADGSTWISPPGFHMTLTLPQSTTAKWWKLADLYGDIQTFTKEGQAGQKRNGETTDSSDAFWFWGYASAGGPINGLTGTTGRPYTFVTDGAHNGRITKITLSKPSGVSNPDPSVPNSYDYDYAYDASNRLSSVTQVSNSTEFAGGGSGTRVQVSYGYDATSGKLNQITTPEGSVYQIGYDTENRVSFIDLPDASSGAASICGKSSGHHCWEFSYEEGISKTTRVDPRGNSWVTKALGTGQIYEATDPLSNTTSRTWTSNNNLASEKDPLGNLTRYAYDDEGNRTTITDALNHDTSFTYYSNNRRHTMVDARGKTTTYTYTPDGDIETDEQGHTIDRDYNAAHGQLKKLTDPRGNVTRWSFDDFGQIGTEQREDASSHVAQLTTVTRDIWGRVTDLRIGGGTPGNSDSLSHSTYDDLGRARTSRVRMGTNPGVDDAADLVRGTTYNRDSMPLTSTDPMGGVTTNTPDRRGRVIAIDRPIGNNGSDNTDRPCEAFAFDQQGNLTNSRVAITRTSGASCSYGGGGLTWSETQHSYDVRNLKTAETKVSLNTGEYPGGSFATTWTYDNDGRVSQVTDPNGSFVLFGYDALSRKTTAESAVKLTGLTGPGCHSISGAFCSTKKWTYDNTGNVLTEKIPYGTGSSQSEQTWTYTYNDIGLLKTRQDDLGHIWTMDYDHNANLTSVQDPLTHTTTTAYDELNRLSSTTDDLGHATSYTFDPRGNRLTLTDPNTKVTTYVYDKANRLSSVTDARTHASSFGYDRNGNKTSQTDPRGKTQSFAFDALNRAIGETTPSATSTACPSGCTVSSSTRYTLDSLKASFTDFNGLNSSSGYDSARRPNLIDYSDSTPDPGYKWDKAGNRTELRENGSLVASYTYDELNRRLTELRGSNTLTYKYDRRDNLVVQYPDTKTVTSAYDGAGRLTTVDDWRGSGTGRTTIGYDNANRKTSQTLPSNAFTSWQYDTADRLTQVQHKASSGGAVFGQYNYTYDNAGNRLTQANSDGTTTVTLLSED